PHSERPPGVSWVARTGRSFLAGDEGELAANVPRLAASDAASCVLLLPLSERGEVEAVVMLVRRLSDSFSGQSVELAATLVDQGGAALALARARAEAGTDPVAGCMNHRAMRRRLDEEIVRATRTGNPLSCLLIDLDDFKLVNDRHGHQAGAAVLQARRQGSHLAGCRTRSLDAAASTRAPAAGGLRLRASSTFDSARLLFGSGSG